MLRAQLPDAETDLKASPNIVVGPVRTTAEWPSGTDKAGMTMSYWDQIGASNQEYETKMAARPAWRRIDWLGLVAWVGGTLFWIALAAWVYRHFVRAVIG